MNSFQGGFPVITRRQRGSGFFSTLKRYLIPIGKAILPHAAGMVGDVLGGETIGTSLRKRGRSAAKDTLQSVASTAFGNEENAAPSTKRRKKAPPIKKKTTRPKWAH